MAEGEVCWGCVLKALCAFLCREILVLGDELSLCDLGCQEDIVFLGDSCRMGRRTLRFKSLECSC